MHSTVIWTVYFVLAVSATAAFTNSSRAAGRNIDDSSFSARKGGDAVSINTYPFMALYTFGPYFTPCIIVNKYFCVVVGNFDPPDAETMAAMTIKTLVNDAKSFQGSGIDHVVTNFLIHPNYDEGIAGYLVSIVKVCPPFSEPAATFAAPNSVIAVDEMVDTVGYNILPDANGKQLLYKYKTSVIDEAPCKTFFDVTFVSGKSICTKFSDSADVYMEIKSVLIYQNKVYGVSFETGDDHNNVASVQAFSHVAKWIDDNTIPL